MNAPFLPPIPPMFSCSSVASASSPTARRRGLLRMTAPVVLALVLGAGLAGCDDTSSTSGDAAPSTAPAESQPGSGGGDSAGSEEAPAEEPAAEPTEDSSGWSGWFGGGGSDSGESSKGGSTPESEPEPQKESDSKPEPQKEYYVSCKEAKAAGVAPLYKGDPGYRPELDRDGDGIACETK